MKNSEFLDKYKVNNNLMQYTIFRKQHFIIVWLKFLKLDKNLTQL